MRTQGKIPVPAGWGVLFAAAIAGYVLLNKPLLKMVLNLRPLGLALAFVVSFCGLGGPLVRRWKIAPTLSDEISASFALGLGLTGLFVFVLGLGGIVHPALYALWTVAGFGLFAVALLRRKALPVIRIDWTNPLNILAVVLFAVFFLQLLPPLAAPEVSTDALEYHLLIPKLYLAQGRIGPLPSLLESNYPSLIQYIYLFILPWAGDAACKAFHFLGGVFLLMAVYRLARRIKPSASLLAPALLFSMPVANLAFGWAWNDAFFVFFAVSSLAALLDFELGGKSRAGRPPLFLAGLMAGLAGWTKYTFFLVFPVLLGLSIWAVARRRGKVRELGWFLFPAVSVSLLVFVKNWIWTGNPVAPFLQTIFRSAPTSAAAAAYFVKYGLQRLEIPDWSWSTYLLFPFRMTLAPALIDIHTGVVPLLLLPFLFVRGARRAVSLLKGFVALSALLWLAVFQTGTRSLLPTLAVLLVVGAIGLEDSLEGRPALRPAAVGLLAAAALANLGTTIVTNYFLTRPIPYFLGKEDRGTYLLREAESQPVYDWLNKAPDVAAVLLVGLHKPYYLDRPFFFSGVGDVPAVEQLTAGAERVEDIGTALARRGITHVAVDRDRYERENRLGLFSWTKEGKNLFEEFLLVRGEEAAAFGGARIYSLR